VSYRESIGAKVKVTLTGPDGKVLKVIEGENPDPFGLNIINVLHANIKGLLPSISIHDISNHLLVFDLYTPSPSSSLGYLVPGFCLTNCPNAGSTPPDGPGIWLFEAAPIITSANGWMFYTSERIAFFTLITGLSYSPLTVNVGFSTPSSPGDVVYSLTNVSQSITNTLSSPVNVRTVMLVGAVYGSLSASPIYVPITFYVFTPPIVFSPGATMTVTVTLSFPYGIAITPVPTVTSEAGALVVTGSP
jgi:hypothetical protein